MVTLAVVLSVVLGIGTNTAIFTVLDAVFLRPVPAIDDLGQIVYFYWTPREVNDLVGRSRFSYPVFREFRHRMETTSAVAAGQRVTVHLDSGRGEPRQVVGFAASPKYFEVLGLTTSMGRFFTPEEDQEPGAHPVVVLSHSFWQTDLGADPNVLDRQVRINGRAYDVVGIGPEGFQGTEVHATVDFWVPLMMWPSLSPFGQYFSVPDVSIFEVFGRIGPNASFPVVDDEAQSVSAGLAETFGLDYLLELEIRAVDLRQVTILPRERQDYERYAQGLGLGVFLVLVLCCINVASLLLLQGRDRARELATRQALGAPRSRLFRQLLTESLLLFLVGGALAVAAAQGFTQLLWRYRPPQFAANAVDLDLDGSVLLFLFLLTLAAGLVTGVVPALRASRSLDLAGELRSHEERPIRGRRGFPLRSALVIPQIALALVALVAGGLYYQGLESRRNSQLGFEPERLAVMTLSPGMQGYSEEESRRFYRQVVDEVEALPGVLKAGLCTSRLLRGAPIMHQVYREGETVDPEGDDRPRWRTVSVSPGFFEAVGLEPRRGRTFSSGDGPESPPVAVINEFLDEHGWPETPALGERFSFDLPGTEAIRVVGVVEDAKYRYVDEDPQGFLYLPLTQRTPDSMVLHARVEGDPATYLAPIRDTVRSIDPAMPIAEEGTMASFLDRALWIERSATGLLNVFGLLCMALALVGVYGMTRYSVRRRRREIGIRMALGARRRSILRRFLLETSATTLAGVLLGVALSFLLVRPVVSRAMPEIGLGSPWVYVLPSVALFLAALLGALPSARKASRLDPMRVLGTE